MEDGKVDESVGGQEEVGDDGSDDVQLSYQDGNTEIGKKKFRAKFTRRDHAETKIELNYTLPYR